MAIINPNPNDFKLNQERALDYQQYRSSSDILRAVAEFYKISVFKDSDPGKLNYITNGLRTLAEVTSDKVRITVTKGGGVFDNQPLYFTDDFIFEYSKPSSDKIYHVYITYKYVEEYPANYAYIQIGDGPLTGDSLHLIAKVHYDSSSDSVTVDLSPRDQLISPNVGDDSANGRLEPVYINSNTIVSPNKLYFVDTSSGALTLTLTDGPQDNDVIAFYDMRGTFNTNPLTVQAPPGFTIHGQASIQFNEKYSYSYFQIRKVDEDKNWYKLFDTSDVLDSGEY